MNLTLDPWIPAIASDGRPVLYSLEDLFTQAHEIQDLALRPHERVAVMRLLLCITHAALDGPADEVERENCPDWIQPRVRDYLVRWRARFELFGEGERFLQVAGLHPGKEDAEGTPVTKLDLTLATGNNPTLFDNRAGGKRALDAGRIALSLLSFQCFAPGGRIGVARWNGQETAGKGSSNHAPCTPSSMVHTLVLGPNLLRSLQYNLLTKERAIDSYGPSGWGKPVWEHPVSRADDGPAVRNATTTYLGRLVPLSRAVRLNTAGEAIVLANGLEYPGAPAVFEPTATIIQGKENLAPLPASTDRSLWRQLAAITVKRRSDADPQSGPPALGSLPPGLDPVLWVGALVTDKAKIEDSVEATYALPASLLTELGRRAYEMGAGFAEEKEESLRQAVKTYASTLKREQAPVAAARQHYWTRVEQHLAALFELPRHPALTADLPRSPWGRAVLAAAHDAYAHACPRQTPRQIQAFTLGLRRLDLRKSNNKPTQTKHE